MQRLALHMPLTDRVYREILDAICDGELAPGQRITQDELAERLNVSRQPVHQAVRAAEIPGLRSSIPVAAASWCRRSTRPSSPISMNCAAPSMALPAAPPPGAGRPSAKLWGPKLIAEGREAVRSGSLQRNDRRRHARFADIFLHELSGNPLIA